MTFAPEKSVVVANDELELRLGDARLPHPANTLALLSLALDLTGIQLRETWQPKRRRW